jgi:hypothetical protein
MAIHNELPIYKASYELLQHATALVKNLPRNIKSVMGQAIHDACVQICILVAKANAARNKVPHLDALLENVMEAELLIRLVKDMKYISLTQWATAVQLTETVGKQANGWKKASPSPAA